MIEVSGIKCSIFIDSGYADLPRYVTKKPRSVRKNQNKCWWYYRSISVRYLFGQASPI